MARKKAEYNSVPDYSELIKPTFTSIKSLGSMAYVSDIHDEVMKTMNLSDEVLKPIHTGKNESEYFYRLKWVLTWMKNAGILEIPKYNMRKITLSYNDIESLSDEDVDLVMSSRKNDPSTKKVFIEEVTINDIIESDSESEPWNDEIKKYIYDMDHYKFEDFCKIILEHCGIKNVQTTPKSRDGGIDGFGRLMINELFSIKIAFQCKHYKPDRLITSPDIDSFRGAKMSRGDVEMGLYITTSYFTKDAKENAVNSPSKMIHLMNIDDIVDKIKMYKIGLEEKVIPIVNKEFYNQFK